MKLIGIVTRHSVSDENHNINLIYNDIFKALNYDNIIVVGIILDSNYKKIINICDGIIFQGGDEFEEYDMEALKYAYDLDKPVLGICLGMQLMGMLFNGSMNNINGHKTSKQYSHDILINKSSKLYNILGEECIEVNSRHKSIIKKTDLRIGAISSDGYIEAVEDSNKKFFIGVQWHPESMISYDDLQKNIFKEFIQSIK